MMRRLIFRARNKGVVFIVAFVVLATVHGQTNQKNLEKDCYTSEFKKTMQFCDEGYPVQCFFNTAIEDKDYENLKCLIDRGNRPTLPFVEDDYRRIPIINAALRADLKALRMFSDLEIDWDVRDKEFGKTALLAVSSPTSEDPEVVRGSYYDTTKFLIKHGANVNAQDNSGVTSLMLSSALDRYEFVKLLLESGADPNVRSNDGMTALMLAYDNPQIVISLLSASADRNLKDKKGRTALFYAIERCQVNKLSLLMGNKKDLKIIDYEGQTPLAFARKLGIQTKCPEVYDYLRTKAIP